MLVFLLALAVAAPQVVGNLVYDGFPVPGPEVAARAAPYANVRSAVLLGFHPTDGSLLVSTRFGETNQVHRVAAPGADRTQLSFLAETVGGAAWDPADPGGLYLAADRGGGEFTQIHWLDRATGTTLLLTDGTSKNDGLAVPTAGGRLWFTSTARNGTDNDLWRIDGHDPASRRLVRAQAGDWRVVGLDATGDRVLLRHTVSVVDESLELYDTRTGTTTVVIPGGEAIGGATLAADGATVWFTSDAGGELQALYRWDAATGARVRVGPDVPWDVQQVTVSADGRTLAWAVNAGGASELWLAPTAAPARARRVDLPLGVVSAFAFHPSGRTLAFSISTPTSPGDVWTVPAKGGTPVRWTWSEVGGLDPERFVAPTLVDFPAADGRRIPAWYYRPPGPGPFPVVIGIHGGPEGQSRPGFNGNAQYWMDELGAAVLLPNVRGSTGYGRTWVALDDGRKRMDSVHDIGAALDWVGTRPELDARRVAVNGGSYGGFMVLASLVAYSDRLACGLDSVGIANFVSFLERTEPYRRDLRRVEYGDERDPEMRAFLASISPVNQVERITRPLFVSHGQNDPRVPVSEAEQIVAAVRAQGGEAWYLKATDEGHGFRRRSNREAYTAASTVFLERCFAR